MHHEAWWRNWVKAVNDLTRHEWHDSRMSENHYWVSWIASSIWSNSNQITANLIYFIAKIYESQNYYEACLIIKTNFDVH